VIEASIDGIGTLRTPSADMDRRLASFFETTLEAIGQWAVGSRGVS
jgi:hypothetical protein